ncbi:ABC transporter [Lancefieldella parvula DNF00906]|uniref:ABC transporter ATP-binding protein n=1 Tax=Lancefieldella parvula TaxID=1382 RepID=UPI00050F1BB9|nr:energy-coupling factor transporter ATPase [Lancefieldella parvula]KGF13278.1 ABC transporter [Lancefieldella parvula DNF00906]
MSSLLDNSPDTYTSESAAQTQDLPIAATLLDVTFVHAKDVVALDHVSFSIPAGKRTCIVGANGSGKSTVASILSGLTAPDEGTVTFLGTTVVNDGQVNFEAYKTIRPQLGLVFQNPEDQIICSVVADDIAFGLENLQVPSDQITPLVEQQIELGTLTEFASENPQMLSGGQQQRVAISGALVMKPQILILDEPSAALDVVHRNNVMGLVEKLRAAGKTIVHVTHFMDEVVSADHVIALDDGRVAFEGTPEALFEQHELVECLHLEEPFAYQVAQALNNRGVVVCKSPSAERVLNELTGLLATAAQGEKGGVAESCGTAATNRDVAAIRNASESAAVSVRDVTFSYQKPVLKNISVDVQKGSHVAVIGSTGSGKSTLARLICALDTPDSGSLCVAGLDTRQKQNRRKLHGIVGYVMQRPERQLFAQTVAEDVAFGPSNLSLSACDITIAVNDALKLVGLSHKADASPFELSGGQQRLCALAGVIAMQPKVLVLDEPTSGLDPYYCSELRKIINAVLEDGCTVIELTHSMEDAAETDQIIVLHEGDLVFSGTPYQTFTHFTEAEFQELGLGIPHALAWAQRLSRTTGINLGEPLTLSELVDALVGAAQDSAAQPSDLTQGGRYGA